MVSDSELVVRLGEILQSSDFNTTTPGTVFCQLEKDFGVDLSERKRFISQQIVEFLDSLLKNEEGVGEDASDEGDGEDVPDAEINGKGRAEEEEEGLREVEEEGLREAEEEEEEGNDEDEEDEVGNNKSSRKKGSSDGDLQKKKRGGFTKLCSLSPQLQEFLGTSELDRIEVVKKLLAYVRENNLQDPNKRIIRCDKKLHAIFQVDKIGIFEMYKALPKHISALEEYDMWSDTLLELNEYVMLLSKEDRNRLARLIMALVPTFFMNFQPKRGTKRSWKRIQKHSSSKHFDSHQGVDVYYLPVYEDAAPQSTDYDEGDSIAGVLDGEFGSTESDYDEYSEEGGLLCSYNRGFSSSESDYDEYYEEDGSLCSYNRRFSSSESDYDLLIYEEGGSLCSYNRGFSSSESDYDENSEEGGL